jgi:Fe-S cluster biogenesis protein NfuA
MTAVHPERTADPRTVRWHVVGGVPGLDEAGLRADPHLAELLATGVLVSVRTGADHLATTLAEGQSWTEAGAAVRTAVQHAASTASDVITPAAERDAVLEVHARRVVDEVAGPYAASHGGGIELLSVRDGVVDVRLRGACHGCPAAGWTVQARLEGHLRAAAPWLVGVRVA